MQENKTIRIWQWSVILLVLCNIGLILTIWLKPHRPDGRGGERTRDYVISQLKLTDAQTKEYDVLIKDHHQAMLQLQKAAKSYHEQLFAGLANSTPAGLATADSLAQLIAANQKQTELITFHHFQLVRNICTDEQKTKLDNIIASVTQRMGGHSGPPPREGDGPRDQGPPQGDGPPPPQNGRRPPPPDQGP